MPPIKAVIFDMGNTLLREGLAPGSTPMAHAPRIEVVPGVRECLDALHGRYTLIVGSNSAFPVEMTATALDRALLRSYFAQVYNSFTLGVSKPNPAFFHAILHGINVQPHQAVMIGDSYSADIEGAKSAGLWTVWLADPAPRQPMPAADQIISDMHQAAAAVQAIVEGSS